MRVEKSVEKVKAISMKDFHYTVSDFSDINIKAVVVKFVRQF